MGKYISLEEIYKYKQYDYNRFGGMPDEYVLIEDIEKIPVIELPDDISFFTNFNNKLV